MSVFQTIDFVLAGSAFFCFGLSGLLCWKEKDGWGWFLFVGLLLAGAATGYIKGP